jgi:hypothetical protein
MGLISQALPSFKGGISQQPSQLRFPDQLERQVNGFSDEVLGLLKRPPSVFLKKMSIPNLDTSKIHVINRDENEKYIMVLTPPSDYVLPDPTDQEGTPMSLTYEWTTPGTYEVELPEWAQTFEYWVLGGGGEGGLCQHKYTVPFTDTVRYDEQTPGESGTASVLNIGNERIVSVGGGQGGRNAVQALGGIPGGLPGYYKDESYYTAPTRYINTIWGTSKGYGGGTYTSYKQRHGGGGTGGYVKSKVTLQRGARTVYVTVGEGGDKPISPKYLGKKGGHGAIKLIVTGVVYNDDPNETPPPPKMVRVFDLEGTEYDVTITPESAAYFSGLTGAPEESIKAVTIADYTFILNKEKEVSMTTKKTLALPTQALIYCKNTAYGKKHEILLNGSAIASYTVPNGSDPSHSTSATTTNVIAQLASDLSTALYDYEAGQDWILLTGYNGTPFSSTDIITCGDGFGNNNMKCFMGEVKSINDLPPVCAPNLRIRVKGYNTETTDDFWLEYKADKTNWIEVAAPDIEVEIDPNTMPQSLVREADGTFTLQPVEWYERLTGDDNTNSKPSFVDRTINDIFFFRNRLGFLSDENIILSKSSEFFQFWFDSATGIIDEDPIDVAVSADVKKNASVNILLDAVPMETDLLVFAKEAQFILRGEGVLSAKNNRVDYVSANAYDKSCAPVSIGNGIYFVSKRAIYSSVYKYASVIESPELKRADDVTAHVPNYLPNGLFRMSGSVTEDIISMLTKSARNKVFVFKFKEMNNQFVQQSWSEWVFPEDWLIHLAEFVDDRLMMLVTTPEGVELHYLRLVGNTVDFPDVEQTRYFIDRKVEYTVPSGNYDAATNKTFFRLADIYGYDSTRIWGDGTYDVITSDGLFRAILEESRDAIDGGSFYLYGNFSDRAVVIGRTLTFTAELSKLYLKSTNQNGSIIPYTEGVLMLRYLWLDTTDCGPFSVYVYPDGKINDNSMVFYYRFTPRILGTESTELGSTAIGNEQFRIPIHGHNTKTQIVIESDSPTPFGITGGGWEGLYTTRARRM